MIKHASFASVVSFFVLAHAAIAGPPGNCCHQQRCDFIPDIDQCFPLFNGTVVADCSQCVPRGQDCWNTTCGETRYDFCETPIPADFFAPGSQPFEGTVYFQSNPFMTSPATIMVRPEETVLNPGECRTIPIALEQLSLVSCGPIMVPGAPPTHWEVQVQDLGAPPGQMNICRTHFNGGTFESRFFVQPLFIFTEVGNPTNQRAFNTQLEGIPPTEFHSSAPAHWSSLPNPCDPNSDVCCTIGFRPGYDSNPGPGCTTDVQCCKPVGHNGPGHIHETGPPLCLPCECGACCLPGHACTEVVQDQTLMLSAEQVCNNMGGSYMGAGSSCADADGDLVADVFESNGCCGPKDNCHTGTDPLVADTDGDGVVDGQELIDGTDPCEPPADFCCHQQQCQSVADVGGDCGAVGGTLVTDCSLCIPRGLDCWNTTCGETRYDFCETPIPADFFYPGSLPFEGTVYWSSNPSALPAATVMSRMDEAVIDVGECQTVPIELVQLSLVSCQPIIVTGPFDTQWNVMVQGSPAPQGAMTICKTHPNGGTFESFFFVQPVFIFTEVGNPGNVRVFDTGGQGIPPTQFDSPAPSNWSTLSSTPVPCDPNTDPCCTLGFTPGYDSDPGPGCTTDIQCCTPVGHQGPGHLHETGPPVCTPCECGACCLPGHACAEVVQDQPNGLTAEQVCVGLGGTYMGAGTSCADGDSDGLADVLESNGCCGPKDNCHTGTDPADADTDDDGVTDGTEVSQGDDPCAPSAVLCCHVQRCEPVASATDCANLGGTVVTSCDVCVPAGNDCWNTECGESRYDFCETPIPADFFNPGSLPFEGTVYWQSAPVLPAATLMRRSEEAILPLGGCQTVPIELVQLQLVSCQPITVSDGTQWDVRVQNSGAPQGSTTICKTHPNGGWFDSTFFVQPVFIFTQVGNPGNVRVFDTGPQGIPPTQFDSPAPSNWSTLPLNPPCNPNFDTCCTQGFTPGYDSNPGPGCTTDVQCCTPVGHEGPGHIHETGPPVCTPCECGACCLPNHTCAEVVQSPPSTAEQVCVGMGGTYMGAGTSCADTDADGLADVLESNGCCGPKDNCHTGTDPTNPDTDGDGVNDGAELAGGDDPCVAVVAPPPVDPNPFGTCSGAGNAVCDVLLNNCPAGQFCDPCNQNRYLSFKIGSSSAGTDTAIRVRLTSLHNPSPAPPLGSPPDYALIEGQYRYLNTIPGTLSRCCNPNSNPTACNTSVSCTSDADCVGLGLNTRCEKHLCPDSAAFGTFFRCARIGCNPEYRDWGSDFSSLITYATGETVITSSTYEAAVLASSCAGNEAGCAAASSELTIGTERWGNVDCSNANNGIPGASDVARVVDKVKDNAGAFIKPRTQLREALPNPQGLVNAQDIARIVDAAKGLQYPFNIKCSTACDANVDCPGGTCVGTGATARCSAPRPCVTNADCAITVPPAPANTCSANGFCTVIVDPCSNLCQP